MDELDGTRYMDWTDESLANLIDWMEKWIFR